MKVALVTMIKPHYGSGDGITEYTYQLQEKMSRWCDVDVYAPLDTLKREDVSGLIYANSLFRMKIGKLAKMDYDVVHITHPELGYVAKILKSKRSRAKIVTSIHDLMRLDKGFHKGVMQHVYNYVVSANIMTALRSSDQIIFTSSSVAKDVVSRFQFIKGHITTLLGTKDAFLDKPLPNKKMRRNFTIGYIGSLRYHKNVIFVLKTALQLRKRSGYRFLVYGSGPEMEALRDFKQKNKLDNVTFMGFAPESKLIGIYDDFDAFIWPSTGDSSSFPIEDAQARGIPVIIYKDNILDNEVRRYSFTADDESHAAKIIIGLRGRGYPKKMRDDAITFVSSISWENTARRTFERYKKLVC